MNISPKSVATLKIQSVTRTPAALDFTFATAAGTVYQVQYKTNLSQPGWIDLGGHILAETNTLQFSDSNVVNYPQKFYRLMIVP